MGLPVAMVMAKLMQHGTATPQLSVEQVSEWYAAAKSEYESSDADAPFRRRVDELLGSLQTEAPPPDVLAAWTAVCTVSRDAYRAQQQTLGVDVHDVGESTYVVDLPGAVQRLLDQGVAVRQADGAVVVPAADGTDHPPMVVQKSNGGYLYSTVDVAALRRRVAAGHTHLLYVVDVAQSQHFRSLFSIGERSGLLDGTVVAKHLPFGLVQGADGRKLSSRAGVELTLQTLLDDGLHAARAAVSVRVRRARVPLACAPVRFVVSHCTPPPRVVLAHAAGRTHAPCWR